MNEQRISFSGGFICPSRDTAGNCMVIEGEWNGNYEKIITKHNVTCLRFSSSAEWKEDNINFITHIQAPIKGIEIYSLRIKDLKPLELLTDLEFIGLEVDKKTCLPDFSLFNNLKACFLSMCYKGYENLLRCQSLKRLNLTGLPYTNLLPFSVLPLLSDLKLYQFRNLTSLEGADKIQDLLSLECYACRNLSNINALSLCEHINTVEFDSCKKITTVPYFPSSCNLKDFRINNCGELESLKSLINCRDLEILMFIESTMVTDGDLSFLDKLTKLRKCIFVDRAHYNRKNIDIEDRQIIKPPKRIFPFNYLIKSKR